MAQKTDPYAIRLSRSEEYKASWRSSLHNYAQYSVKVARLRNYLELSCSRIVDFNLRFTDVNRATLYVYTLRIEDLEEGKVLSRIKR